MLKSTPMTSKNRSWSSIFKLNQDTPEIHPWYRFGPNVTYICWVIVFTSENCKYSCLNRPPMTSKIGQGHPSSNITRTFLRYIHGMSLDPMRLIFVELLCLYNQNVDGQTDRRMDGRTDGHANPIVRLVTRNPPKKALHMIKTQIHQVFQT